MKISTRNLKLLPDIDDLKKLCQAIAVLEVILSPEWEYRFYSFDSKWSETEMLASMRTGSGDEVMILFNEHGACINGFAHDSSMSPWKQEPPRIWPGILEDVPGEFIDFITTEPVPTIGTTFCIWKKYSDPNWQTGKMALPKDLFGDGSAALLSVYDAKPRTYKNWAEEYYEKKIPSIIIKEIYSHTPFNELDIKQINRIIEKRQIIKDIVEIDYPFV